jgi:hypothetical protein
MDLKRKRNKKSQVKNMAVTTATESQPLLSNPLSRLSSMQKRFIVLTVSAVEVIGGIYSAINTVTDRERTSFDYTKFSVSLALAGQGALTSFLCLKGLFPFQFRSAQPQNNGMADQLMPAEPLSYEGQVFFNQKLDELLRQCEIEIRDSDHQANLQTTIERKCTLLTEYIQERLMSRPDPTAQGVDISEIFRSLDALGQLKIAVGSAPPSRSGSRYPSAHTTPVSSPSKRANNDESPPRRRNTPLSTPSSPTLNALEAGQAPLSVKKED